MNKNLLIAGSLLVMTSCGRYSKVLDLPTKEEYSENKRIYGEMGQPAHQSKNTYPTAPDAAEKSVKIKEILFGKAVANSTESVSNQSIAPVDATVTPADTGKK